MSEEDFLARWSRRKRESRAEPANPAAAQSAPPPEVKDDENELDLSSLPSIDEIDAATDITTFLRKGIPQDLSRAALRRAWAADPAIRDFVGLAENAWDFNDPTAMTGFGSLDCTSEELAALVERIVGGVREAVQSSSEASIETADSSAEFHQAGASEPSGVTEPPAQTEWPKIPVAVKPAVAEEFVDLVEPVRPHTHGGALPR